MTDSNVLYCTVGSTQSVEDYAENFKVDDPSETCEEPELSAVQSCGDKVSAWIDEMR